MADDAFDSARAQFMAGLQHLQAARWGEAETCLRASLALLPGRPSTLLNLGATLLGLGRPQEALEVLDQALAASPDDAEAMGHRGLALAALRRPAEALAAFERVLALQPQHAAAAFHRAQVLQWLGRTDEALSAYDRVLALQPDHARAWSNRGGALKDLGRNTEAVASFERALALGADASLNGFYLASLGHGEAPAAAPVTFVQGLFDDYAAGFDAHLQGTLDYRAPERLTQLLAGLSAAPFECALDLGCGTGLCGPLLRPLCRRLEGVDLSAAMLERAAARGVYDALHEAELLQHLRAGDSPLGLVLAADVFIYLGALEAVFAAVRRRLAPGGVLAFSAELPAAEPAAGWELQGSLRYAHGERYLTALAAAQGLAVRHLERGVLRADARQQVVGLYVVLQG